MKTIENDNTDVKKNNQASKTEKKQKKNNAGERYNTFRMYIYYILY